MAFPRNDSVLPDDRRYRGSIEWFEKAVEQRKPLAVACADPDAAGAGESALGGAHANHAPRAVKELSLISFLG